MLASFPFISIASIALLMSGKSLVSDTAQVVAFLKHGVVLSGRLITGNLFVRMDTPVVLVHNHNILGSKAAIRDSPHTGVHLSLPKQTQA